MTYRWVIRLGSFFVRLLDVRVTVTGIEHVPAQGPVVLAISHFSYLDFLLTEWAIWRHSRRYTRFMAIQAAFAHRVSGWPMRAMGHIPVGRGPAAYRLARTALRDGQIVGIFPETRVSRCFTLLAFKGGAAKLARETGAPLVPCVIWGSHRIMTRTHQRSLLRSRHTPVFIRFGPPVADGSELRDVMAQMMRELQTSYPVDGKGAWWQPAELGGGAPNPAEALRLDGRPA